MKSNLFVDMKSKLICDDVGRAYVTHKEVEIHGEVLLEWPVNTIAQQKKYVNYVKANLLWSLFHQQVFALSGQVVMGAWLVLP